MPFLRKSSSLVMVWIKSLVTAARCSFCSGSRSCRTNFATNVSCQDPSSESRTQFWESTDQLLVLTLSVTDLCWLQPVHVQHSQVFCLLQAFQNVDHFQQILDHLWRFVPRFYLHCTHCISLKAFWITLIGSTYECSSLTQNSMQICCSTCSVILNLMATQYKCSVVHMLTQ